MKKADEGAYITDKIVNIIGSWRFIILQTLIIILWGIVNVIAWIEHWDPYPFILLNLFLSLQAAYAGPVIMMSQNRQAALDRLEAHNDFLVNLRAEQEINEMARVVNDQQKKIDEMYEMLLALKNKS